jgi:putative addiction module component (TIGR02574 family)
MAIINPSDAVEKLKPVVDVLTPADRLALGNYLLDSVDEDPTLTDDEYRAEWEAELMRRIKETEMGLEVEIPAEEVRRMARESLR